MDHPSNTATSHDDDDEDSDDDDEFFGAQDDDDVDEAFGDMAKHELQARHQQLKTSGFLDAFDESKEELLQEGFEAGFTESFALGQILGKWIGRAATHETLASSDETNKNNASQRANTLVHEFFVGDFQANRDPTTVQEDLSRLVQETRACFENEENE